MKRLYAILILALVALSTFAGRAVAANTFVVFPIEASAKYKNDARVMTKMLRSEIDGFSGTKVYGTKGATCRGIGSAKRIRRERGVDAVVIGELTTLGGELQLLIDVVWEDDVHSYSAQLESTAEFPKIVHRLAEAIRYRKNYEAARGVDSISKAEMYPYKNKIHGMWKYGFSLAMIAPMSGTYLDAGYMIGLLPRFRYEIAQVAIEGETGVYYADNTALGLSLSGIPLELATHYYFMNADISPYVGASFGAHLLFTDLHTESRPSEVDPDKTAQVWDYTENYWMFTVGAYAGLELLRTHTMNVNFRVGYRYGFVDFGETLAGLDTPNGAHGLFMQVGITWDIPTRSYKRHHSDRYRYNKRRRYRD